MSLILFIVTVVRETSIQKNVNQSDNRVLRPRKPNLFYARYRDLVMPKPVRICLIRLECNKSPEKTFVQDRLPYSRFI